MVTGSRMASNSGPAQAEDDDDNLPRAEVVPDLGQQQQPQPDIQRRYFIK